MLDSVTPRLGRRDGWFDGLALSHYWNHAAQTPPSEPVCAAMRTCLDDLRAHGVTSWMRWAEQRDRLRGKIAQLVGAAGPDDIGLVGNTTSGVQAVALGIPWRAGDRILLLRGEFPTNVTPWQRAAEAFGCEIVFGEVDAFARGEANEGLAHLERELERGLRLVAVSAVQFQTGLRMPLEEIGNRCRAAGADLFVDGIQAAGIVPMTLRDLPVDYFAAGSHKWLNGPDGGGFVYIHPSKRETLRPTLASWLSHEDGTSFLFEGPGHLSTERAVRRDAKAFVEGGLAPSIVFAGLEASVDALLALGVDHVYRHVQRLHDLVETRLVAAGYVSVRHPDPARRSGILSFLPPEGVVADAGLLERIDRHGVCIAVPDGHLRLSPHWPNDERQVEPVAAACVTALSPL